MRDYPKPQEFYRHFKGNLYQVLTLATHSETGETMVVYQAMYGDYRVYCREAGNFLSEVDRKKYPDARALDRCSEVEPGSEETIDLSDEHAKPVVHQIPVEHAAPVEPVRTGVMAKTIEEEAEELHMDPLVIAFLDADSASSRIRVLEELRGRVTDEMINMMAMAAGIDVEPGETWQRFNDLRESLRTIEKFETNRLRD
jgi:hypothetical protein